MTGSQGTQAFGVEAGDQMRDGVAGASSGGAGGVLIVIAAVDGQDHGDACDLNGGRGLRPTDLSVGLALGVGDWPEGILFATGHGGLRGSRSRHHSL